MNLQPLGEAIGNAEKFVEPRRKELEKLIIADPDRIDRICPIDQHPAPDHQREERKIDPMQPSDRERMFLFEALSHKFLFARIMLSVLQGAQARALARAIHSTSMFRPCLSPGL